MLILAASPVGALSGCSTREEPTATAGEVAGFRVANVASAKVLEASRHDGQTYARVEEAQWTFWIRTSHELTAGDYVLMGFGEQLKRQRVDAMSKTFRELLVIEDVRVVTKAQSIKYVSLAPVKGGVAIADLFARRDALAGKPVVVRGRVVKASMNIFETNWYHLQDGTGVQGTNDLTVTSTETAGVGDVIVARAPLSVDHSLGFGYDYDAILLDAKLEIESSAGRASEPQSAIPRALINEVAESGDPNTRPREAKPDKAAPQPKIAPRTKGASSRVADRGELEGRGVLGLELGVSDDDAIVAWLEAREVTCAGAAAERRKSFSYDCTVGLPPGALPERAEPDASIERLMFSHTDDAPLGHVMLTHRFALGSPARASFSRRVAALQARLGEPSRRKDPSDESFDGAQVARASAAWSFDQVEVSVTLVKIGAAIRLHEKWSLVSDDVRHEMRPGATPIHGSISKSPNPHVRK